MNGTEIIFDSKLLSIYIPTYNRPEEIQRQVRLLLPQLKDDVILIVLDNCSDIPVRNLFTSDELQKFTIKRNKVNIGGDANIARCFEDCSTSWLWTLSDDDFVKDNSVEIVLNEILNNKEAVFICFGNDHFSEIAGFEKLAFEFRKRETFTMSFAMSYCAYNISKLQPSLQIYYNYLSSMVGTIILVLKYIQNNKNEICIFTNKNPIEFFTKEVGWNYAIFISRSKLFFEAFETNKKNFNKTLFLGCHKTNYQLLILDRKGSNLTYKQKWKTYLQVIKNQGFINAILYSPKYMIYVFLSLIIGNDRFKKIMSQASLLKKRFNKGRKCQGSPENF